MRLTTSHYCAGLQLVNVRPVAASVRASVCFHEVPSGGDLHEKSVPPVPNLTATPAGHLGKDDISLIEHRAPFADSPPLHIHHTEDEAFYLLEGALRFQVGHEERRLSPGQTLLAPKGLPHTYRVESSAGARWLTVTTRGDFERFVRTLARPADQPTLPPPAGEPTPEAVQRLSEMARAHGIEIVGPPLR
ncbi:MAG: cupin domain-containing protein [Armatimonadota bacterium]|nr:cupin domain-containing protein [Armatimonadota bacterium]MDR7485116.1 cupin domain-containing protein [Armatimonadota bacterium]MDR7533504.1 cupin domain-containing protein [Armatimonadota bacterium]MDR7536995.1 cupin domain-containing protein [Armatimonadota bacterium]